MNKNIYSNGFIYEGVEMKEPQYDEFEPEEGQRNYNQGDSYDLAFRHYRSYLKSLSHFPVLNSHNFTEGEDVTGRYELQYQEKMFSNGGYWRKTSKENYGILTDKFRRIVAIPLPQPESPTTTPTGHTEELSREGERKEDVLKKHVTGDNKLTIPFEEYLQFDSTKDILAAMEEYKNQPPTDTTKVFSGATYPCQLCEKEFTDEYDLAAHMYFNHK